MLSTNEKEARLWGMLCHLTALSLFIGIPFGHLLGPLIVWLIKRNDSPEVDFHGKESLNFQLSMTIYGVILTMITVPLMFIFVGFLLIPLGIVLVVADIVLVIIASIQANDGVAYRYPFTIRLIA